jgi:hypothetical protein
MASHAQQRLDSKSSARSTRVICHARQLGLRVGWTQNLRVRILLHVGFEAACLFTASEYLNVSKPGG